MNPIWQPTQKQSEFLSAAEFEVLFGGSAGGGKSQALIVDALGLTQNAVANSNYRAALVRRSFGELRELIDRTRELYPVVCPGAVFREVDKLWRFPSGAVIEFLYVDLEKDKLRFQGREWSFLGVDELTQIPSESIYEFMISRVRSSDSALTPYVRATCNPGGPGGNWVQKRFRIPDEGRSTRFSLPVGDRIIARRFIRASLEDNPYLKDTGYRENLLSLNERDRRALLEGRWDQIEDFEGSIFRKELAQAYAENRVCTIPIDSSLPLWTAWDLGLSDQTYIVLFQAVGKEIRIVDTISASNEPLTYYANLLQQRNHPFAGHLLPHDVAVRELSTNKSRQEVLESLGVRPLHVVPRVRDLAEGIEAVRQLWPRLWIDSHCKDFLHAAGHYRREFDPRMQVYKPNPVHGPESHAMDALRQIATGFDLSLGVKSKPRREMRAILR